eukprot:TRINITY_DN30822_c0_g1_i13.p1 TRINITY_DN30822_c0_g1~~TRINITY_DN30822_c0_g1_i13.p1  ORF type:complete len:162 (+),score=13.62 TRINITY_DN30822_c0_g1_i13:84-569(+)
MVRRKHRYAVVQLERTSSIALPYLDVKPLKASEDDIFKAVKIKLGELHGDYGRAVTTLGMRVKYLNEATRIVVLRARQGEPFKMMASTLPFVTSIGAESIQCTTLYIAGTIRHSLIFLEKRQKRIFKQVLEMFKSDKGQKKYKMSEPELKERILQITKLEM